MPFSAVQLDLDGLGQARLGEGVNPGDDPVLSACLVQNLVYRLR